MAIIQTYNPHQLPLRNGNEVGVYCAAGRSPKHNILKLIAKFRVSRKVDGAVPVRGVMSDGVGFRLLQAASPSGTGDMPRRVDAICSGSEA
jgi:hypothetical protein